MLAKCTSRIESVDDSTPKRLSTTVQGSQVQTHEDELADSAEVGNDEDDDDDEEEVNDDDDGDGTGGGGGDDESQSDDELVDTDSPSKKRQHKHTQPKIAKFARFTAPSFASKSFGMSQSMLSWLNKVRTR